MTNLQTIIHLLRDSDRPAECVKLMDDAAAILETIDQMQGRILILEQLLRDSLTVMNAASVGYKTQEAIEKLLEGI